MTSAKGRVSGVTMHQCRAANHALGDATNGLHNHSIHTLQVALATPPGRRDIATTLHPTLQDINQCHP